MLWRQESDFRDEDGTNKNKCKYFENEIVENLKQCKPYLVIDYEELESFYFLNSGYGIDTNIQTNICQQICCVH